MIPNNVHRLQGVLLPEQLQCTFNMTSGADPEFPLFVQMHAKRVQKKLKPRPLYRNHAHFRAYSPVVTAAADLWISNLAKVSESTVKHDSTS